MILMDLAQKNLDDALKAVVNAGMVIENRYQKVKLFKSMEEECHVQELNKLLAIANSIGSVSNTLEHLKSLVKQLDYF